MGGWETDMIKKKVGTVLLVVMTVGLLAAVIYFSFLLNNKGDKSVTQIKKTKASAQTYHKLLALNVTPIPSDQPDSGSSSSSNSFSSAASVTKTPTTPPVNPTLLANNTISPTLPASAVPTSTPVPTQPVVRPPTSIPTPTVPLLAYRTITPTLIPVKDTGGTPGGVTIIPTATVIPSKAIVPTKTTTKTDTLPETGWVQFSSILFIVAATTIFISFLF